MQSTGNIAYPQVVNQKSQYAKTWEGAMGEYENRQAEEEKQRKADRHLQLNSRIARDASARAHSKSNTLGVVESKGDVAEAGRLGKSASTEKEHNAAAFAHKTASAIHWLIGTHLPGDHSASHFEASRLHEEAAKAHSFAAGRSASAPYNHHKPESDQT